MAEKCLASTQLQPKCAETCMPVRNSRSMDRFAAAEVARFNIGADEMHVGFVQYHTKARIDSWQIH